MSCQCLMIKTKDKRKFFTHEKNLPQLLEFSKTFGAEISTVKVSEAEILDLKELAPAICDTNRAGKSPKYEVVEVKVPIPSKCSRCKTLQIAKKIKEYILGEFSKGEKLSLKDLKKRFKRYELSTSALSNHIARVRIELAITGVKIKRIGAGTYQMEDATGV